MLGWSSGRYVGICFASSLRRSSCKQGFPNSCATFGEGFLGQPWYISENGFLEIKKLWSLMWLQATTLRHPAHRDLIITICSFAVNSVTRNLQTLRALWFGVNMSDKFLRDDRLGRCTKRRSVELNSIECRLLLHTT